MGKSHEYLEPFFYTNFMFSALVEMHTCCIGCDEDIQGFWEEFRDWFMRSEDFAPSVIDTNTLEQYIINRDTRRQIFL